MAHFNATFVEQNAFKRDKSERRRGPKPVRTSLLWAQTSWLEAQIALSDGRVVFQNETRTYGLDGALLEATKRALDKLAFRVLSHDEAARLATRRQLWGLWNECASLENVRRADLRSRFVLESLLNAPLIPSPAREVAQLPLRQQTALLHEYENDLFPSQTRDLARWIVRNRQYEFWQQEASFPVNLACRLGWEGDAIPALLQGHAPLGLDLEAITALLETRTPEQTLEVAHFWHMARWDWPSIRSLHTRLKPADARELSRAWHELELKWRSLWLELWRELARANLAAAKSALQFHELFVAENFVLWQEDIYRSMKRTSLLKWFDARNEQAYELIKELASGVDTSAAIELMSELWLEFGEVQTEKFWDQILRPTLQAAQMIGVEGARELRSRNRLDLVNRWEYQADFLRLALEWTRCDDKGDWFWTLSQLTSNPANAAFLRREAEHFFAICDRFPGLNIHLRSSFWDDVLPSEDDEAFNSVYWRLARALAPTFLAKTAIWHAENLATRQLGSWLYDWAILAWKIGWSESAARSFCEMFLTAVEANFQVLEAGDDSRVRRLGAPLETFIYLSHWAGESDEACQRRLAELMRWLAHGKSERLDDWWDAGEVARKCQFNPILCAALLRVGEPSPSFVREILPSIGALRRLRLTTEMDALEEEICVLEGEFDNLVVRFPTLEAQIKTLAQWQRQSEQTPSIPASIRELLSRTEKWTREAEFLRSRLTEKPNAHFKTRLENLETRMREGDYKLQAEVNEALDSAIDLAMRDGLRSLITRALRGRLDFLCGSVVERVRWNDDWANALLIACELDSNRKWATKLLRGQSQNASGWQRYIPANQKWLEEFAAQGKDRAAYEASYYSRIGEWELWIERDALQILQMGNRFSTCLSRGGCNSHSTIANALDANKLVVYARRDGQIQARQLWAVTSEGKLGGFHIYANLSSAARKKSGVQLAFHEFATRFAGECRLQLNENTDAEIPELCGAQWYDDGLVSWASLLADDPEEEKPQAKGRSRAGKRIVSRTTSDTVPVAPSRKKVLEKLLQPLTQVA